MKKPTHFNFTILILIMMILVSACGSQGGSSNMSGSGSNNLDNQTSQDNKETISLSWAATSQTSGFYPFNVAVVDILNNYVDGIQVTVLETGGTADNLKMIENGEAQLGQSSEPNLYEAQNGLGIFEGEPFEESRLLFLSNPLAYYFTVTKESGVESFSDLTGEVYNPGPQGSNTEILSYDIIESILGYSPNFRPSGLSEAVNAMKDRQIIGFTKSGPTNAPDSALQDVATSIDINILSFTEEEIAKVKERFPFYSFVEVDGSLYGQDNSISTVGLLFGSMVSKDLSEDLVYGMVKVIFENTDYIAESYHGVKGVDMAELTAEYAEAWLHPGTVKYLREQGYEVRADVIPPEMK